MNPSEEQVRAAIAEQAGEWFAVNDEGPLDARDSAALAAWLKTSPVHIEEFLGVSAIARDLREARTDPQYSLEAILARARAEEEPTVQALGSRDSFAVRARPSRRWLAGAVAMAASVVLSLGLLSWWNLRDAGKPPVAERITELRFETGHGEQLSRRLADNSVLHLNTDSAVTIRYSKAERLVTLTSGQAGFEVAHEPGRPFRVLAGSAEVVDIGTQFDVRLAQNSTVVTVVEGRVEVGPSPMRGTLGPNAGQPQAARFVELAAGQQLSVAEGEWPAVPITVDVQSTTAWLRQEIVFDHEPLERVAAEYNRYTTKPIEIATPALRNLPISGEFATNDPDTFIAFLRSLKGVRVEVTPTRISVSRD
jgi:transmembrane sensor